MIRHFDGMKMFSKVLHKFKDLGSMNNSKFESVVLDNGNLVLKDSISTIATDSLSLIP